MIRRTAIIIAALALALGVGVSLAAPAAPADLDTSMRSECCGDHTHADGGGGHADTEGGLAGTAGGLAGTGGGDTETETVVVTVPGVTSTKIVFVHHPVPVRGNAETVVDTEVGGADDDQAAVANAPVVPTPIVVPEPATYVYPVVTPFPEDDVVCFPADATVELEGGAVKRMDALAIGDRVRVGSGATDFSDVFMFTHKMEDAVNTFVQLKLASGDVLRLTPGHYMYANGAMTAAKNVAVGDKIELGSGARTTVASVSSVTDTGLFNPQTLQGDIVVNGVRASTYTTAVEPTLAHSLLAPLRFMFSAGIAKDPSFGVLENGAGPVTSML